MQSPEATSDTAAPKPDAGRIVLRNTMYLGLAEILVVPISIFLNGLLGRYLGAEDMGYLYLSMTITKFAFLAVDWGHGGALPAAVVMDRDNAGKLLGSSLAWRGVAGVVACAVVMVACQLLGYDERQLWVIALMFLVAGVSSVLSACQDVIRGFERTDIAAYSRVGSQFLMVTFVVPVLLLGGRIHLAILAQAVAVLGVLVFVARTLRPIGVGNIGWQRESFKKLMRGGTPFVVFGFGLVLQPGIDAFYLARLSPPDVVGWFAVAQKLVGFLILPAMALVGALYPTLCRLFATDIEGFRYTTRNAISAVSLLVVPASLCCGLYPEVGVSIFGRETFAPAEDTLRVFAVFLVLVYFTLPLGTAMVAAGRQRAWAMVQICSVASSVVFDPLLIGYFQERSGNGGIGLAMASTISEGLMVVGGLCLIPKGVLDRGLGKTLSLALLSGAAMAGAAFAVRGLPALAAAPIALAVYVGALLLTGGITRDQKAAIAGFVRRKIARGRAVG